MASQHDQNASETFNLGAASVDEAGSIADAHGVFLRLDAVRRINFASAQNSIPVIRSLAIENEGSSPIERLTICAKAEPQMIRSKKWIVDRLDASDRINLTDLEVDLDTAKLGGLNEAEFGRLIITAEREGERLCELRHPLEFLARDQWGGLGDMGQLLAAYVSPNEALVAKILKEASDLLRKVGKDDAIDGYQSGDPQRAYMIAGAIWSAATGLGLTYAHPPVSFEREGQKVRSPSRIQNEGLATCLDTSLLLAAAWEQAGLNPVVLFSTGHAWAGVWLKKSDFGRVSEPDVTAVRKACQAREFIPVETTFLTSRPPVGFEEAWEVGMDRLSEDREAEFQAGVDISRSRAARIRPLASHVTEEEPRGTGTDTLAAPLPRPLDIGVLSPEQIDVVPKTAQDRIARWQGKLLDLTMRNRLINFKTTQQAIECKVPDIEKLVNMIISGTTFQCFPMKEEDPVGDRKVNDLERKRIIESTVQDCFSRNEISVSLTKKEMEYRLIALHRKAKSNIQEGGTNTLFLAAGFLRWVRHEDNKISRAPLLLVPIKLSRKSARSPFKIECHEDDIHFNATLVELLKKSFDIQIPEMESVLSQVDKQVEVNRILNTIKAKVRDVSGFEVVNELVISNFSFAKYLMWKDLVDRTDKLRKNRLVEHLVDNPEENFSDGSGPPISPSDMDRVYHPMDLVTPLPADSSQLAAVAAASEGRDFVLVGPPGTGKSQTIANIIAQCLATGKTVLFVAEKAAALNVVQRRLKAHGLGDAVLELHSNKTDRKRVIDQLGRGWMRASEPSDETWIDISENLRIKRDELNAYTNAVHNVGSQGFSIFKAVSWIAQDGGDLELSFENKDSHDAESFKNLEDIAEELGRVHSAIPNCPRFSLVSHGDWSFEWQRKFLEATKTFRDCAAALQLTGVNISNLLHLRNNASLSPERKKLISEFIPRMADDVEDLQTVPQLPRKELKKILEEFENVKNNIETAREKLGVKYNDTTIDRIPVDEIDSGLREAATNIWPISLIKRAKFTKLLATYAESKLKSPDPERDVEIIREIQNASEKIKSNPLSNIDNEGKSPALIRSLVEEAISVRKIISDAEAEADDQIAFGNVAAEIVAGPDDNLREHFLVWKSALIEFDRRKSEFERLGGIAPGNLDIDEILNGLKEILDNENWLNDWTRWVEVRCNSEARGLASLASALENESISGKNTVVAFRAAYARWWLPMALDASNVLRRFRYWEHENLIHSFRELDEKAIQHAPFEVMRRISHSLPAMDAVARNSELGDLRHQLRLQKPSMPIRTLLGRMPQTLPKLSPCILMSPLSIAQYLPADQKLFDVVIFDEASQIPTWDAIGAIARARQSIVVGDPKQLPPTSFFDRSDDEANDGDANSIIERDMPSIIDEVLDFGIPTHVLNWHYRSRDESLIAFSNHYYYGGRLVTFPAPVVNKEAVRFHKVDGIYARGSGRHNEREAKAVSDAVRRQLKVWLELPEEDRPTIGVITFNRQQQSLIQDFLDQSRRNDPSLEWFFSDNREEPVIVKNLENIQGDERDVILFSITFGPDDTGKMTMNFGPLNSDGGERRLNVAVTRARCEMHVFASITHDQIDLSRVHALGVKQLKTFLDYASRGAAALAARDEGSLGPAESPFEESVATAFKNKGWEVRTQIGVSGFRIDIGIVDPDRAGAYLAGIECDGATYHSSATARDRDKVRQAVLEGLGWRILRIWSTDWFRDPGAVVDRLNKKLLDAFEENRKERERESTEVENNVSFTLEEVPVISPIPEPVIGKDSPTQLDFPTPIIDRDSLLAERSGQERSTGNENRVPTLVSFHGSDTPTANELELDPEKFFDPSYFSIIQNLVRQIVDESAPILLQKLCSEVASRHGFSRAGSRIQNQVERALDLVEIHTEIDSKFVWPKEGYKDRVPYRGLLERSVQELSRTEISSVLDELGPNAINGDDELQEVRKKLGISRMGASTKEYILSCDLWRLTGADNKP